jgi:D-beta-D-heptose 7-phosphate kinase/D-beta-D-heptose 1-phosphate adenosyltransferase
LENRIIDRVAERLAEADSCIISDYSKGVVSPRLAKRFIELVRQTKKPLVVDPKARDFRRYHGATVITPNLFEARRAAGCEMDEEIPISQIAARMLRRVENTAVLITRGSAGMSLYRRGIPPLHIPASARSVFDVTGAGDTVVGALALAMGAGQTLDQAAMLANRAAGIVVGKLGTACVTLEELTNELDVTVEPPSKEAARLLETPAHN